MVARTTNIYTQNILVQNVLSGRMSALGAVGQHPSWTNWAITCFMQYFTVM